VTHGRGYEGETDEWSSEAKCEVKGKVIPLQTWTEPEGSRRLRLSDFKIIGT
jgi:hypothetical protein